MTSEKLRQVHRVRPFVPFDVNLADGRSFRVSHPEMVAIGARQFAIIYGDDEAFEIVDLLLVTSLSVPSHSTAKNGKKRR